MKTNIVNRPRKYRNIKFEIGNNCCSITKEFAKYVVSKEKMIK